MNVKSFLIVVFILLLSNVGVAQTYNPKNSLNAEGFLSEKFDFNEIGSLTWFGVVLRSDSESA